MKVIFLSTIFCCLFFFTRFGIINNTSLSFLKQEELYKTVKIDSVGNYYLIYFEKNDSVFKVLSKKERMSNCLSVKKGEKYNLCLKSWFKPEEIHLRLRMDCVKIEGDLISIERNNVVSDLFLTDNLIGLCYISDN
jgi:hypothetical protein